MSSTDSMSGFFSQPRGNTSQQQSTESMSSTQLRFSQMTQGMGMGSGASAGTTQGTTQGMMQGIPQGTFQGSTQGTQQSTIPSMPGMRPTGEQGTQVGVESSPRSMERNPLPDTSDTPLPELIQLSFQEALARNIGEYVVIEFLVGTNMIEQKQGILYNVGVSFVTLFEEVTKTFVICDLFSIKFVTFYLPGQRPPQQSTGQQTMTTGGQTMRGR